MTLIEKNVHGPVKTIIERGANFIDDCIVVQDYNTQGQLKEIRFFYNQMKFDTSDYNEMLKVVNDTVLPFDSSFFMAQKYPNYDGLDTLKMEYSHKICFNYSKTGKLLKEIGYDENNELYFLHEYYYNTKDSIKKEVSFYPDSANNLIKTSQTRYKYITRNSRIKMLEKSKSFRERKKSFYVTEHILRRDTIIQSYYNNNNGQIWFISFEYGKNSKVEKFYRIFYNDTILENTTFLKFTDSLLIEQIDVDHYNEKINSKNVKTFTYDSTGILIKSSEIDSSFLTDFNKSSTTYFDSYSNPYMIITNSEDTTFISYEYDDEKNWITRKRLIKWKKKEWVNNRKIIYY
ncbi:MAG: hypothetical protein K8R63_00495 [Bacteroidales bacterium]|nr:hypothetical protein [Bacteroidales bacterium]